MTLCAQKTKDGLNGKEKKKGKKKDQFWLTHYWHGLRKDVVLCPAPPHGCQDTQHPTWRIQEERVFSEIRWLGGRGLHTTRSIALISLGVVFNVSSYLFDFCSRSDCM